MKIYWTCEKCGEESEVDVSPFIPAQVCGPPESCYPAEGGELDPDACPHCNHPIPQDAAQEKAADVCRDAEDDVAELRAQAREDDRRERERESLLPEGEKL